VEWDAGVSPGGARPDGATRSYEVQIRSAQPAALALNPPSQASAQNVPITFTATAKDTSGQPYAGKILRYSITGSNPRVGSTTIGADGSAQIVDGGATVGQDVVTAFVDLNNDGVREAADPLASSTASFVDHTAPKCTVALPSQQPGGPGIGRAVLANVKCDSTGSLAMSGSLAIPVTEKATTRKHATKKKAKAKTKTVVKTYPLTPSTSPLTAANAATVTGAKVPAGVAKKFATQLVTATVTVTAKDASGNTSSVKVVKKLRLARYAVAKKKKKKK
jgi:hypothetical protein